MERTVLSVSMVQSQFTYILPKEEDEEDEDEEEGEKRHVVSLSMELHKKN